jgi:hypothetical protein
LTPTISAVRDSFLRDFCLLTLHVFSVCHVTTFVCAAASVRFVSGAF